MAKQYDFDIDLFSAGNAGGYHIQNLPDQKQREHLVQYGTTRNYPDSATPCLFRATTNMVR